MKIGVNYLLEAKELYEEGKIDFIDYFKLFSLNGDLSGMDWCVSKRWVMFHGACAEDSSFGDKNLIKRVDIQKTKEMIKKSNTPYMSAHIFAHNNGQTEEELLDTIKENIADFKKEFGLEIALENVPYRDRYEHCEFLIRPETISKIVRENNIMFLFDISHARRSAEHFGMTLEEYVSKLPMERVVEFHLAGIFTLPDISKDEIRSLYTDGQIEFIEKAKITEGERFDNHGILGEDDYIFLKESISKYNSLKYITLEYGSVNTVKGTRDEDVIYPLASFKKTNDVVKNEVLEQLNRIKQIVDEVCK